MKNESSALADYGAYELITVLFANLKLIRDHNFVLLS